MDPLSSLLASTNRLFVLVATVISMILGMLWYSKALFGNAYMRWMGMGMDNKNPGMMMPLIWEFISRVLYFTGLGWAFAVAPQTTTTNRICLAIILWLAFPFSMQLCSTIRSPADKRILWITGSNMLLQTIIAVLLWTMVF